MFHIFLRFDPILFFKSNLMKHGIRAGKWCLCFMLGSIMEDLLNTSALIDGHATSNRMNIRLA